MQQKLTMSILHDKRLVARCIFVAIAIVAALSLRQAGAAPNDGAEQFPHDDAIFLRLAQHWTLDRDGSVRYREQWAVKLRNNRPLDRFADPRISHLRAEDTVIIHEAQSVLPDGSTLDVPEFSRNFAATDALAGWPLYAGWQDLIISFSGIEPGVVLKLDYEVVSPAGTSPWLDGLVRLNDSFPIVERTVSVSVPEGTALHHQVAAGNDVRFAPEEKNAAGMHTYRWTATNLVGERDEPLALPWVVRSPHLKFTTCANPTEWVTTLLSAVDRAALANSNVEAFARAAVEKETLPGEQVRKVAAKVRDTFNFVESSKALRRLSCRDAQQVLQTNYGNDLEAGALLLAAVRSLGFTASARVSVKPDEWIEVEGIAPALASFDAAVVQVTVPEGILYFHPHQGEIKNPSAWGRRTLLGISDGRLQMEYLAARGEKTNSEVEVTGKVSLAKDGTAKGELRLQATGAYFDPAKLQTSDEQKAWATTVVAQVLSGMEVSAITIGALSDDKLRMTVQVSSTGSLPNVANRTVVRFGQGPCLPSSVVLPLERSERFADVRVGTRIHESIDLTLEIPTDFKTGKWPASLEPVTGSWGAASQSVKMNDRSLRFTRSLATGKAVMSATEFLAMREILNTLHATRYLTAAISE